MIVLYTGAMGAGNIAYGTVEGALE